MSDPPFHQWVAAAAPRDQTWRTLLGCLIILIVWTAWSLAVSALTASVGLVDLGRFSGDGSSKAVSPAYSESAMLLAIVMATFGGLWLGLWVALRVLHRRSVSSVFAHDRGVRLGQFGAGAGLALVYLTLGLGLSVAAGNAPARSEVEPELWLAGLLPLACLILIQSAGEEVVFRGYLPQQLASRWRHPLIWGLLPALLFGLAHGLNGAAGDVFSLYYITAATLMGLVMMAMVWRTGSLAASVGFHFVNNIGALLTVAVADISPPVSLWVWRATDALEGASADILLLGLLLAFVLSPWAPLPKGHPLTRKDNRAAP
jgi:membrane protease YdiL (CAAX protease family)